MSKIALKSKLLTMGFNEAMVNYAATSEKRLLQLYDTEVEEQTTMIEQYAAVMIQTAARARTARKTVTVAKEMARTAAKEARQKAEEDAFFAECLSTEGLNQSAG